MNNNLESGLFETGVKFTITNKFKDGTFTPGSMGFTSSVLGIDHDHQNVAEIQVIIIRKGKAGKHRLNQNILLVPIFLLDNKNFMKLLPVGTKKYFVQMERVESPIDTMEMAPIDFMGWSSAMALRLEKMSRDCHHRRWPNASSNPLNKILRANESFDEDPDYFMKELANEDSRSSFVHELRRMDSSMIRIHLLFNLRRADCELDASEFLEFVNKGEFIPKDAEDQTNEYKFMDDNKPLVNNIKHYSNKREEIMTLLNNYNSRREAALKSNSKKK